MVTSATNEAALVHGPAAVGATVGATVGAAAVGAADAAVGEGGGAAGVSVAGAAVGEGAAVAVGAARAWQAVTKTTKTKLKNTIAFFISTPLTKIQFHVACFRVQAARPDALAVSMAYRAACGSIEVRPSGVLRASEHHHLTVSLL